MSIVENLIQIAEVEVLSGAAAALAIGLYATVEDKITRPERERLEKTRKACIADENSPKELAREETHQQLSKSIDNHLTEIDELSPRYLTPREELDSGVKSRMTRLDKLASRYATEHPTRQP